MKSLNSDFRDVEKSGAWMIIDTAARRPAHSRLLSVCCVEAVSFSLSCSYNPRPAHLIYCCTYHGTILPGIIVGILVLCEPNRVVIPHIYFFYGSSIGVPDLGVPVLERYSVYLVYQYSAVFVSWYKSRKTETVLKTNHGKLSYHSILKRYPVYSTERREKR